MTRPDGAEPRRTLEYASGPIRRRPLPWLVLVWVLLIGCLIICISYDVLTETHKWENPPWYDLGISAVIWKHDQFLRIPYLMSAPPICAAFLLIVLLICGRIHWLDKKFFFALLANLGAFGLVWFAMVYAALAELSTLRH